MTRKAKLIGSFAFLVALVLPGLTACNFPFSEKNEEETQVLVPPPRPILSVDPLFRFYTTGESLQLMISQDPLKHPTQYLESALMLYDPMAAASAIRLPAGICRHFRRAWPDPGNLVRFTNGHVIYENSSPSTSPGARHGRHRPKPRQPANCVRQY
jgi:hypothetical protein